jgi:hypothetical protein
MAVGAFLGDQRPRGEVERETAPPRIASTTKAIRTCVTSRAKNVASPAATPPKVRPSTERRRRLGSHGSVWLALMLMTRSLPSAGCGAALTWRPAFPRALSSSSTPENGLQQSVLWVRSCPSSRPSGSRLISRRRLRIASALVRASMAPSQRRQRCCPQGTTLGLTLGFANHLVAGRRTEVARFSSAGSVSSPGRRALGGR